MKEVFITLNNQIRGIARKAAICCAILFATQITLIGLIIFFQVKQVYFPIQKCEKILSKISSVMTSPVISSRNNRADFKSIEIISCSS